MQFSCFSKVQKIALIKKKYDVYLLRQKKVLLQKHLRKQKLLNKWPKRETERVKINRPSGFYLPKPLKYLDWDKAVMTRTRFRMG